MKPLAIATLALILAGCAALDKPHMTSFRPNDGGFQFVARGASWGPYAGDSPDGEQVRPGWLKDYADQFCQRGYAVTDRDVIAVSSGIRDVYYTGKCK